MEDEIISRTRVRFVLRLDFDIEAMLTEDKDKEEFLSAQVVACLQ